jgi:hypothetical protein
LCQFEADSVGRKVATTWPVPCGAGLFLQHLIATGSRQNEASGKISVFLELTRASE